jgi:integrase/recombinase XerD
VAEAVNLRYDDITADGLVIRCTKFRKSRLVPLHGSAMAGLERYLERRRPYALCDDHVFVSIEGTPLHGNGVDVAFRAAAKIIGLPIGLGRPRPTPHALRHTFAVRALETCSDDRDHITKHMLALSTYLGHARIADTYWYLQATPELMANIAERSERFVLEDPS